MHQWIVRRYEGCSKSNVLLYIENQRRYIQGWNFATFQHLAFKSFNHSKKNYFCLESSQSCMALIFSELCSNRLRTRDFFRCLNTKWSLRLRSRLQGGCGISINIERSSTACADRAVSTLALFWWKTRKSSKSVAVCSWSCRSTVAIIWNNDRHS